MRAKPRAAGTDGTRRWRARIGQMLYRHRRLGKPLIAGLRRALPAPAQRWLLLAAERVAFRLTPRHQAETLPPIFLHWAGRHVRPLFERFGADSLEDMYFTEIVRWQAQRPGRGCAIASLGAGRCEMEIALTERLRAQGIDCTLTCIDLNRANIAHGRQAAAARGLAQTMAFQAGDCVTLTPQPGLDFDIIIVNQFFHHVDDLHAFCRILASLLRADGLLLSSDVIGRNGHLLWPATADVVNAYWAELPSEKTRDRADGKIKPHYPQVDHAAYSNEGVRAQEVVGALLEHFQFDVFITFGAAIIPFVERRFGFNFSPADPADAALIERIAARDAALIAQGRLLGVNMFAVLCHGGRAERRAYLPISPERHHTLTLEALAGLTDNRH